MKKAKRVTFHIPANNELAPFKPLYLLSTANFDPAKRIWVFISSCEKNCYIHEKDNWQKLVIDDLLLGHTGKTYCFSVKQYYRYLDIPNPDQQQPYLTKAKNSKDKVMLKIIELSEEILQELALPNLEQLDTSAMVKTKQEAEKVLQLKTKIAVMVTKINNLKSSLLIFVEAKAAMEKVDNDKKNAFTVDDIDTQIKLIKRQIHYHGYIKLKNEVKIETLLTKGSHLESESFERSLLELRLQKKETSQIIQNLGLAIHALKRMAENLSKNVDKPLEDLLINEYLNQEIQSLKKKKSENKSKLENIEEKIKISKQPKASQNPFLVTSQARQFFFNDSQKTDPIETAEKDLKSLTF